MKKKRKKKKKETQKECKINLNELKKKENDNENLLNVIKNKGKSISEKEKYLINPNANNFQVFISSCNNEVVNKDNKYPEKINAIVEKKMYNIYKDKYNELTGRLDKDEMKRRQREANRFHWKDDDLINKMIAVNNMKDKTWFKPEFTEKKELSNSVDDLNREMLKPLVMKGNEIHIEEDKIKDKLEEEYPSNKYYLLGNPCKVCIKLIIYSIALSILITSFFVKKKIKY